MLIKPVFSEKSYAATALDRFTFRVDKQATKDQIKKLVEKLFTVNVVSVNTLSTKRRTVRSPKTGKYTLQRGYKKAIVQLKSGQKIKLFNT